MLLVKLPPFSVQKAVLVLSAQPKMATGETLEFAVPRYRRPHGFGRNSTAKLGVYIRRDSLIRLATTRGIESVQYYTTLLNFFSSTNSCRAKLFTAGEELRCRKPSLAPVPVPT